MAAHDDGVNGRAPGPTLLAQAPTDDGFTLWHREPAPSGARTLRVHVYAPPFEGGGGREVACVDVPAGQSSVAVGGLTSTACYRSRAAWVFEDGAVGPRGPGCDADTLPAGCGPKKAPAAQRRSGACASQ